MKIKYVGPKKEKRLPGEPKLRGVVFKKGEAVEVSEEIGKRLVRFDVFEEVGEQLEILGGEKSKEEKEKKRR